MRKEYITYPYDMPISVSFLSIKNYPIHWHNTIEIIYVLEGNLHVDINSTSSKILENNIEIINLDEAHRLYSEEENKVLLFHIDPYFFEKYYTDIENMFFYTDTSNENSQNTEAYDELKTFLSIIVCEVVQKSLDYDEEIEKNLINILFHLINNFHYLTYDNEEIKDDENLLERYHRIAKYIFNNYNNNITLKDIANKEFLSTHYLSHEIKYATGLSFTDLVNLTRVEESIKLLLDTDKTISDICEEVGFSHSRYYNKHFKNYYGLTPLQYRKKFKVSEAIYKKQKIVTEYPLNSSLKFLSYYIDDYDRFNYENKINKITIDMNDDLGIFNKEFKEIINVGDAFDLLIEDNKDTLEELQKEIGFNYVRMVNIFSPDMGVFPGGKFFNWIRAYDIFEYVENLDLKPLIVLNFKNFSDYEILATLTSFLEYFNDVETLNFNDFKFQFDSKINKDLAHEIKIILEEQYNLEVLDKPYSLFDYTNSIYDTAYMLPYIIYNSIYNISSLYYIKAFDTLDKQVNLTNEVFFGYPGLVNSKGIKKPSYYAYYLLNMLGTNLVAMDKGYIVTKSEDEYQILIYSFNESFNNLLDLRNINKLKKTQNITNKLSINILNIRSDARIIEYDISEKSGSSYDYWISMGKPKRLKKEEKEILHKSSFPKINFKYTKKSIVLNIQGSLEGYGAKLIILKET
ncbi:MAG: helix-turn-helix domain-containing protein [Clostridium perfringens]|nr:helix-turn-helix domain-containing protein [Clostridium perfringens]